MQIYAEEITGLIVPEGVHPLPVTSQLGYSGQGFNRFFKIFQVFQNPGILVCMCPIKKETSGLYGQWNFSPFMPLKFPGLIYIVNTVSLVGKQLFNTLTMISLQFN